MPGELATAHAGRGGGSKVFKASVSQTRAPLIRGFFLRSDLISGKALKDDL